MINLVVTCAKRKSLPVADGLHLGQVLPETPIQARGAAWLRRLQAHAGPTAAAADLYIGEQWFVLRDFLREAPEVRLWVCSAGYGLVPGDAPVAGYSATFSTNHPDAVAAPGMRLSEAQRAWWRVLSTHTEEHPLGKPFTLERVAREHPDEPLLIAASPVYLRAMREDLVAAGATLSDPELLSVFSAGADRLLGAQERLVAFDGRLRQPLGGSMMSLNVRVLRETFRRTADFRTRSLRGVAELLSTDLPALEHVSRAPISDAELDTYLGRELGANPGARWSALHKRLRQSENRACEQKRFRKRYLEWKQNRAPAAKGELAGVAVNGARGAAA